MPDGGIAELKDLVEQGNKTFADYMAANDERIAELKKIGNETPEMKAKLAKADGAIDELKAKLDAAQKDTKKGLEDLESRLVRKGLGGGGQVSDLAVNAAKFKTVMTRKRQRAGSPDVDVEAYERYCDSFEDLVRAECNADMLSGDVRNSLSIGSDRDGGYLVPTEMSTEMATRLYETSPMRSIARVINIGAPAWEAPYKASQAASGGWVGEKQARTSTATPTVGMQRIETHEQYAYPEVTQAMLDDGAMDVAGFLIDEVQDTMSRTENTSFVSGDGVMKPKGFLGYASASVTTADATRAWGVLQYTPTGQAGGFPKYSGQQADDAGCLIDIMASLNPVYRPGARWAMNRTTEATIRKLRDQDGRYLVGFGMLGDGAFGFSLHGHPITNLEDMPAINSGTYSAAFGDFSRGYYIIDRIGFRVLRDPYTNKPYVGFYVTKRTGGDVRHFDAIKLLKFSAS